MNVATEVVSNEKNVEVKTETPRILEIDTDLNLDKEDSGKQMYSHVV